MLVDSHEIITPSANYQVLVIISDLDHLPCLPRYILPVHGDVLIEGEIDSIVLVDIGIRSINHEGQVTVIVGDAH